MRRELFTAITPFVQGARLGAYVTGTTLALSLFGAVGVLTLQSDPATATPTEVVVATDAPSVPPMRATKSRTEVEIDPALLAALEDARPVPVGDVLLELSREAADVAETAVPTPPPAAAPQTVAPAAPAAPAVPVSPPLVVTGDPLREVIAEYFPDQVDFAYSVVMCESAGNARAISRAGYYGLWQFDLATWQSVGGTGLPSNASVEEQMARARALFDARGWQPWGCA